MSKFTFISERFDYDEDTGEQRNLVSKTTREFHGHHLDSVLDEMTEFLRGAGYHFDGHVDVVSYESEIDEIDRELDDLKEEIRSQRVFDHIVRDIQNNPFDMKSDKDSFGDIFISNESIHTDYGAAGPTLTVSDDDIQLDLSFDFEEDFDFEEEKETCDLCKLPISVMKLHQCFDPKCPTDAYRNQYAD